MGIFDNFTKKKNVHEAGVAIVKKGGYGAVALSGEEDDSDKRSTQFKIYKEAYERVPLITAIIDVQADQAVQEYYFEGPNKTKLEKWANKVNLTRFLHQLAKTMLLYGNSYVEVIKTKGEISELKLIDPVWVDVYRKPTGEVIGYSQIIENKPLILWGTTGDSQKDTTFSKRVSKFDSIIHFKHNVLNAEKYGFSVIKPLIESINIKLSMESNLRKVLKKYVAPLIWAKVGNDQYPANDEIVGTISDTLRDLEAESEVTTTHLVELGVLDFNAKGMDIKTPLDHVETQIITGGQVPPVLLGRSAGTDKATAEVQLRAFGRHTKSLQRELKFEFEDKIIVGQDIGESEDQLIWTQAEEREREIEIDILRGLVTDGIITPQKANDLLAPRFREKLPTPEEKAAAMMDATGGGLLNGQQQDPKTGLQKPRDNQMVKNKVKDNPNDPTQTTQNKNAKGRVVKTDRKVPIK